MFDPIVSALALWGGYRVVRALLERNPIKVDTKVSPLVVPPDESSNSPTKSFPYPLFQPHRGAHRTTQAEAFRYLAAEPGPLFDMAGVYYPARQYLNKLTFITGRPGSGKTTMQKMMLASLANLFPVLRAQAECGLYSGEGQMRWALMDPANAYLPYLYQILPPNIGILRVSPQDADGVAWDVAKDVTSEALNTALQTGLFPDALFQKANDPFWYSKARAVSEDLVRVFHDRCSDWAFHDLVIPFKFPQFLKPTLMQSHRTRGSARSELAGRLGRDIVATGSSVINKMALAAAMWRKAKRRFSLKDFLTSSSVLHFAYTPDLVASLAGIGNAMMYILILLGLKRQDEFNHTILICDESKYLADISGIDDLAAMGRGSGMGAFIIAQGLPGLYAKWGESRIRELLDLTHCWITFSAGRETADAFVQLVGQCEGLQRGYSNSANSGRSSTEGMSWNGSSWAPSHSSSYSWGTSSSEQFSLVIKNAILTSEITGLPLADAVNDLMRGFAFNPQVGAFGFETSFLWHFKKLPRVPFWEMPIRPDKEQILEPWGPEDIQRLKLDLTPSMLKALRLTWGKKGVKP